VHLGVELNVVSKASLADALALALHRVGKQVTRIRDSSGSVDRGNAHSQTLARP
jgi:rsbT co-antagonist protein RsbR